MLILSHNGQNLELPIESLIVVYDVTEEQYAKLTDEDLKIDYDGERLFIHSPTSYRHERLMSRIWTALNTYLTSHSGIGDVVGAHFTVRLPGGERIEPDIVVLPPGGIDPDTLVFEGIPLLIMEVVSLSPSAAHHDLETKKKWYTDNKVPELWHIIPERAEVTVYTLTKTNEYRAETSREGPIRSKTIKGFSLDLPDLFSL